MFNLYHNFSLDLSDIKDPGIFQLHENLLDQQQILASKAPTVTPTFLSNKTYTPGTCSMTSGAVAQPSKLSICTAYNYMKIQLSSIVPKLNEFQQSDLYGKSIRMAFHDAGEADLSNSQDKMGPDGCLSNSSDNAGLVESFSPILTILEPIWQESCNLISRADFYALWAKVIIESIEPTHKINIPFQFGRLDNSNCNSGAGRLPDAQDGLKMIKKVFETQMGLTLHDAVTLIGAHTIGHVHPQSSGYGFNNGSTDIKINSWDGTPLVFDNRYFNIMINVVSFSLNILYSVLDWHLGMGQSTTFYG